MTVYAYGESETREQFRSKGEGRKEAADMVKQQLYAYRTEWHIGIGEDSTGMPIPDNEAQAMIRAALEHVSREYGGASVTRQDGAWVDPSGRLIVESGITIVAYSEHPKDAEQTAVRLCHLFRQTAVIVAEFGPQGFTAKCIYGALP